VVLDVGDTDWNAELVPHNVDDGLVDNVVD